MPIGTLAFNGQDYLNGWVLPNFYFHYTSAYNILRHNGVPVGRPFLAQCRACRCPARSRR